MTSIKRRRLVKSALYTDVSKSMANEHDQAPFLSPILCIYDIMFGGGCQYKKQSEQEILLFLAGNCLNSAETHLKCNSLPEKAGYRQTFEIIG